MKRLQAEYEYGEFNTPDTLKNWVLENMVREFARYNVVTQCTRCNN